MQTKRSWHFVARFPRHPALLLLATVFLAPRAVSARNVTVNCNGGPADFPSITAAVNALDLEGPNSITVTGNCKENVFVNGHDHLALQSAAGQVATINATDSTSIALQFFQSREISLTGFVLQGGANGLLVNETSDVDMQNCIIQNNSSDGAVVQIGSTLVVQNSIFQNNGGNGLTDAAASNVTLATFPAQRIRFLGNASDGIDIDGSFLQVNFGTVDIENNAGAALFQQGGRLLVFGPQGAGTGNVFQGNGEGIDIFNAGSATFFGKNTIRNNADVGLQVLGSSVRFLGGTLPDGTLDATVIQGHVLGVNVVRMGELTMSGPHQVQNNGNATADPAFRGGIRLNRASVTLNGSTVSNNIGPGIRTDHNSGLTLINATDNNNSEEGVRAIHESVADFVQPLTIVGNGIASISCDNTSLIFGNFAGITGIACGRIAPATATALPQTGRVVVE